MMVAETPSISSTNYATSTYIPNQLMTQGGTGMGGIGLAQSLEGAMSRKSQVYFHEPTATTTTTKPKKEASMSTRRIVQVFIADIDENVPLDKSVIYEGKQQLTDATDQELYFEIDIKGILDEHNKYRTTLINKKVKERTEHLEPVKVRDLKMVVVNVAMFG